MLNTNYENPEIEPRDYQMGKLLLLNDLASEPFLRWQLIFGIMSTDNPNSMNPRHAEAFLDLYFTAYLGERREFSGDPEDLGRKSWLSYMGNQISYQQAKNIEISPENKEIIFEEFEQFIQVYIARKTQSAKDITLDPLSETTKKSIENIVK